MYVEIEGKRVKSSSVKILQFYSLRAQFQVDESGINPLHGSDSKSAARREIEKIFPVETTVAVIKPEAAEESGGEGDFWNNEKSSILINDSLFLQIKSFLISPILFLACKFWPISNDGKIFFHTPYNML